MEWRKVHFLMVVLMEYWKEVLVVEKLDLISVGVWEKQMDFVMDDMSVAASGASLVVLSAAWKDFVEVGMTADVTEAIEVVHSADE